jgi:phytoene/squalene synthetase
MKPPFEETMNRKTSASQFLAMKITKSASKQTYYTIRLFVDRDRVADAFRAYGYFRWVDDILDAGSGGGLVLDEAEVAARTAFLERQQALLEACYRGEVWDDLSAEERMLVDLVRKDTEKNSGLQAYLRNMMDVMAFDVARRGRTISQAELSTYSRKLGTAVTEAIYHFIGHDDPSPCHEARYLAVTAAHITHMLRDAQEDVQSGYFNIPQEVLQARGISPWDIKSQAYREWVCGRVQLARGYFKAGRECTRQVKNWRCRLAGYAYTARFEWMLRAIERDNYCLRCEYPERKGLAAGLWMTWFALTSMLALPSIKHQPRKLAAQPVRIQKR